MNRRLVAWVLVVVFLVCSCAAPVCSSAPLAADGGARRVLASAGFETVSRRKNPRSRWPTVQNRRLLGTRTTWLPPPPLPNKKMAAAKPAPPPPLV